MKKEIRARVSTEVHIMFCELVDHYAEMYGFTMSASKAMEILVKDAHARTKVTPSATLPQSVHKVSTLCGQVTPSATFEGPYIGNAGAEARAKYKQTNSLLTNIRKVKLANAESAAENKQGFDGDFANSVEECRVITPDCAREERKPDRRGKITAFVTAWNALEHVKAGNIARADMRKHRTSINNALDWSEDLDEWRRYMERLDTVPAGQLEFLYMSSLPGALRPKDGVPKLARIEDYAAPVRTGEVALVDVVAGVCEPDDWTKRPKLPLEGARDSDVKAYLDMWRARSQASFLAHYGLCVSAIEKALGQGVEWNRIEEVMTSERFKIVKKLGPIGAYMAKEAIREEKERRDDKGTPPDSGASAGNGDNGHGLPPLQRPGDSRGLAQGGADNPADAVDIATLSDTLEGARERLGLRRPDVLGRNSGQGYQGRGRGRNERDPGSQRDLGLLGCGGPPKPD